MTAICRKRTVTTFVRGYSQGVLTHALAPQPYQLWVGRGPSAWQEGIEAADEALNDTEAGDAGSHRSESRGGERLCGEMADGNCAGNEEGILKKNVAVRTGPLKRTGSNCTSST